MRSRHAFGLHSGGMKLCIIAQKALAIHQVTTILSTSKNVLFQGYNHLLTTGTDDPSLAHWHLGNNQSGHQYRWLVGGYDLAI